MVEISKKRYCITRNPSECPEFVEKFTKLFLEQITNIKKKLNILGAGDNFAAFILNELVTTGKITKEVLKKAHYFASAYCLENKNI